MNKKEVTFATEYYDNNICKGFARASQAFRCLWPVTDVIAVKNTANSSAVVSCEDELILLRKTEFSVELYLVRAVHNFDYRHVQTEYLTQGD
jgi:hypothetical protein